MLFDLIDGVDTWVIATQSIAHKLICALQKWCSVKHSVLCIFRHKQLSPLDT